VEERITFDSDGLKIEGLLHGAASGNAAVITHPHPLYGGDMHNPVVSGIVSSFQGKGYTTLCFNFRGTGGSQGRHDEGIGERNDVIAAIDYLKSTGADRVDLAGYSFGAWVNAHVSCGRGAVERMVMVSPPIGFIEFETVGSIECLELVITGSRDDIAPPGLIEKALPGWNPQACFEVIQGADHFYSGFLGDLTAVLENNL